MTEKIKLPNRDGANLYLERIPDSNVWKLSVDDKHKWVLEHIRVIGKQYASNLENAKDIFAIDPAGGPFIQIGDKIDKYQVAGFMEFTEVILVENEENNNE